MTRGPEPKAPRPAWSTALRARRIQLNLRQEDVAARTDDLVSQGTISDLERGKTHLTNITAPRLAALARALEWTPEQLEEATDTGAWRYLRAYAEAHLTAELRNFGELKNLGELKSSGKPEPDMTFSDGKHTFYVEAKANPGPHHRASAAEMGYRIPRSAPRPIDSALLKAAEEYGDKTELAPLREYRWLRTLNDIPFKRRPVTPEEWLAVFLEYKDDWNPQDPEE